GLGADVVDENHRGPGQWPADPPLVRPELVNDLGIELAGLARGGFRGVRHILLRRFRRIHHGGGSRSGTPRPRCVPPAPGRGSGSSPSGTPPPATGTPRAGR